MLKTVLGLCVGTTFTRLALRERALCRDAGLALLEDDPPRRLLFRHADAALDDLGMWVH